ncbi:hypothetical protein [Nonomuraea sp. NPDC003804]|jgi:hypothetical protein|uniref:hypothetical protein n=1 Tax=Bacteria TaxID=2 RepID=UPI0033B963A8
MDENTRRLIEEMVRQQVKEQLELACRPGGLLFPPKGAAIGTSEVEGKRYVSAVIQVEPDQQP